MSLLERCNLVNDLRRLVELTRLLEKMASRLMSRLMPRKERLSKK